MRLTARAEVIFAVDFKKADGRQARQYIAVVWCAQANAAAGLK
jgi:hypothetical protein